MKAECIDAVTQAIGRSLNANEQKNNEDRVRSAMPTARAELQKAGQAVTPRAMLEMAAETSGRTCPESECWTHPSSDQALIFCAPSK